MKSGKRLNHSDFRWSKRISSTNYNIFQKAGGIVVSHIVESGNIISNNDNSEIK